MQPWLSEMLSFDAVLLLVGIKQLKPAWRSSG